MTDPVSRLVEIKARRAKITPGDWGVEEEHGRDFTDEGWSIVRVGSKVGDKVSFVATTYAPGWEGNEQPEADAVFIAAAPADVGWLLEQHQRQQDLIAEFRLRDEFASRTIKALRSALHDARRTAALRDGND
jgi:hypothetical protein